MGGKQVAIFSFISLHAHMISISILATFKDNVIKKFAIRKTVENKKFGNIEREINNGRKLS